MKRIFLSLVPSVLSVLASKFDGIKLPEPQGATEYSEGPMSFLTCGFPGFLDASLRVLMFRPIDSLEYACHARLSFRPLTSSADLMTFELDFEALVNLFRGTGVRTIDAAGKQHFAEFYRAMDSSFINSFRMNVGEIRLTEDVVTMSLRRAA